MQTLYAVEAWVLAVLGWAWLTVRELMPGERPLVEEWANYGILVVSTLNLLLCAVSGDKTEVVKGYLGYTLVVWTFVTYASFDSVAFMGGGDHRYVPEPANGTCCPNQDVAAMNRALYFGGSSYSVPTSAVTIALLTLQVFVASAGAMVTPEGSVWPGNGWGYGVAALLAAVYALRYTPGILEPVCPDGAFASLFSLTAHYGLVFTVFGGGMNLMILLDVATLPPPLHAVARAGGAGFVCLFAAAVYFASDGRGMMTVQLCLMLAKAALPPLWGLVELAWGDQPIRPKPPAPRALRWVMPAQCPTLPIPLTMDRLGCPPRTRVAQDKKQL